MTSCAVPAAAAGTWTLGDLKVNRVGFGAMRLTGRAAFDPGAHSDRGRAIEVLRRAIELGVNHIDTAAFYFSRLRSANELINSALAPYADDLVIATKIGPARDAGGEWATPARPDQLRGQVEENLRQLGRDHLDLVNLRVMGEDSVSEHFGALAELRDAGLVRHLGISAARPEHLAQAQEIAPVVCVQNRYGIDARGGDGMLRACAAHGIAFVPFFSLAGEGREAGAVRAEHDEVRAVARAHGVSTAQVRLAWVLQQGAHVLAIPGTGDPEHLADSVAAAALRLTEEELRLLDSIGRPAS
ncbi:oxidoreductase [Streptomyces lydicus]|uniref:Aldo/keto reductase n=1 Tax=Streptomyces lydicus TaxID=47763 RepID=A0A1D7VN83_9ACTN|nr:oxidoreductase [Streptomyces lydicus]AOP48213.1 aldo/keto reductase [Streptomyces lydicus]